MKKKKKKKKEATNKPKNTKFFRIEKPKKYLGVHLNKTNLLIGK